MPAAPRVRQVAVPGTVYFSLSREHLPAIITSIPQRFKQTGRTTLGNERINSIESMGSIPFAVLAVVWLLFAGWGAGRLLRVMLRDSQVFDVAREIVYVVAGLHVVALFGVSLGMTGLLFGSRTLILSGMFSLLGIAEAWRSRLPSLVIIRGFLVRGLKPSGAWFIVVPFVLLTLGPALNYPAGWDELVYHSVLPRRWMTDGWPAFYVDIPYSGFPSLVEVLCWLGAPLESLVMSRLLIWVCWILGLVLAHVVLRRGSDHTSSIWLAFALAAIPISLMISANCYVEAFQLLDLLAVFVLLDESFRQETHSQHIVRSILLGILVGGAAAVKLTGAILIIVPLSWYVRNWTIDKASGGMKTNVAGFARIQSSLNSCESSYESFISSCHSPKRVAIRWPVYCATIVLTSLLVAMPFYLRPWMFAGNPFYPYFANWFSNDTRVLETSLYHHSIGSDAFGMRGILAYLTSPVLLAWDDALYDGTFGWQWIVLLGLSILGLRNTSGQKTFGERLWLGSVAVILYSFWFFTAQQARFALPLFITVTMLASHGLKEIKKGTRTFVYALLVGITLFSLPWTNAGYYFASWERLLGIWSNTQYVDDSLEVEYVPLIAAIEKSTPADARLLLLFEHRSLYIPRQCVIGTPFFQAEGLTPPEEYSDPDRVLRYLNENKFTHVVFATKPLGPDRSSKWWNRGESVFASIEKGSHLGYLKVLWSTDNYAILEVVTKGP